MSILEPELIIDPQRQVVLESRDLTTAQDRIYNRSFFTSARPDLTDLEFSTFLKKMDLGDSYLHWLKLKTVQEFKRANILYPASAVLRIARKFQDDFYQLAPVYVIGMKPNIPRDWQDQSKLVNYVDKILFRISKYGLDLGRFKKVRQSEAQQLEDEIYQRLLREMRVK